MTSPLKAAILRACERMLEPLARLLIESGVGVGDFQVVVKRAFVRAARASQPEAHRPNISRIASVTGLTRGEVGQILRTEGEAPPEPTSGRQRAERVLTAWWNDYNYLDGEGRPALLPLRGARKSFASLVKRYSGDPRVVTILDELIRVKAVRRLPDGRLEALSRTCATARWDPEGLELVGERIHDHLQTLLHNVRSPARPRYERLVLNTQLDPRYAPMLIRDLTEQAEVLADSMDGALNDPSATLTPGREPKDAVRLGLAMYLIEEPIVIEPAASSSPGKPGRRRPRGSGA